MEGTWKGTKMLHDDGSYTAFTDTYIFGEGKVKTWSSLTIYGVDTTELVYRPSKTKHKIDFEYLTSDYSYSWIIEDIDKETMVARTPDGVYFFDKVN